MSKSHNVPGIPGNTQAYRTEQLHIQFNKDANILQILIIDHSPF